MYSLVIVDYYTIERSIDYIEEWYRNIIDVELIHPIIVDNTPEMIAYQYIVDKYSVIEITESIEGVQASVYSFSIDMTSVVLICAKENMGYGKGNNLGARVARLFYNDEYCIFSNNDLEFHQKISLADITSIFKQDSNIAVIGPRVVSPNGEFLSPMKYTSMWQQTVLDMYHMLSELN